MTNGTDIGRLGVWGGGPWREQGRAAEASHEAVAARARQHYAAGAGHVCVQVLTATPDVFPRAEYHELASVLAG